MMPLIPLLVCVELPQQVGVMIANLVKNVQEHGVKGASKIMIKDKVVQVGGEQGGTEREGQSGAM
jgi:hypothetical protein